MPRPRTPEGPHSAAPLSVAVVGAGPAGFYAADAFLRRGTSCRIDVIDRLPTPFGLVRAGVAPDHQSTKNVTRAWERVLQRGEVRLIGNVALGETVSYDELRGLYDAVVLAFGAQAPRRLDIAGEDLEGVCDATSFVAWYNAVPGAADLSAQVRRARAAVVVGNGNVALDIARLLAKTGEELAEGDIDPRAAGAIAAAPLSDIYVVGRRGPLQASFTAPELAEFGGLAEAGAAVSADDLPEDADSVPEDERTKKRRNLKILRGYADAAAARPVRVRFVFNASPASVLGDARMSGVRLEHNRLEAGRAVGTGRTYEIGAQLLVSAIGYRVADGVPGVPLDARRGAVANDGGRVAPGVYVTGWARRGPTGVIGTNRNDARGVVERIFADGVAAAKPGPEGLDALLAAREVRRVDYSGWRRIDAAEIAAARAAQGDTGKRPRVKFTKVSDMLAAAGAAAR